MTFSELASYLTDPITGEADDENISKFVRAAMVIREALKLYARSGDGTFNKPINGHLAIRELAKADAICSEGEEPDDPHKIMNPRTGSWPK